MARRVRYKTSVDFRTWREGFLYDPPPAILLEIESDQTAPGPPHFPRAWYRGDEDDGEVRWYRLDGSYEGRSCDNAFPKFYRLHPQPRQVICEYLLDDLRRVAKLAFAAQDRALLEAMQRFAIELKSLS